LGRDRRLAAHQSAIQSPVPDVVWPAGVCFLFASVAEQERRAELGWSRVFWVRIGRDVLLVGTASGERSFTDLRQRRRAGGINYEPGRVGHRFVACGGLLTAAERSE